MTTTTKKPLAKKPVQEKAMRSSLSRLIESEMDKAEIVLNAKAIIGKLQKMAEELAKIEADDLMPVTDQMRTAFGPQMTDAFNRVVTERVRGVVEAVKQAKDQIGNEVSKLEGSVNGEQPNDMAMTGMDAAPTDDLGLPPEGGELPPPEGGEELPPEGGEELPPAEGDELGPEPTLDDDGQNAAGRPRKESARPRGRMVEGRVARRMLRESDSPDGLIYAVFRRELVETRSGKTAAARTARLFGIDGSDVAQIVRESVADENPWQHLEDQGYTVTCDGPGVYYWHMRRKDGKPFYDDNQDGTSSSREAAWADLEATLAKRAKSDAPALDPVGGDVGMDMGMGMDEPMDVQLEVEPPLPAPPPVPAAAPPVPPVAKAPLPPKPPVMPAMPMEGKKPAFGGKQAPPFGKKDDKKDAKAEKKADPKKAEKVVEGKVVRVTRR